MIVMVRERKSERGKRGKSKRKMDREREGGVGGREKEKYLTYLNRKYNVKVIKLRVSNI